MEFKMEPLEKQHNINRLTRDLTMWQDWCKAEQEFINKCTDQYALQLLNNRLASGQRMIADIQKELVDLTGVTNA